MEYFRGLCSERMIIRRKSGQSVVSWEKIYERNEPLDCRNYARAAYRFFNWDFGKLERMLSGIREDAAITKMQAEKKKPKRVVSKGIQI